ncbi:MULTISPECIES: arginase [Halomicrobium]|uniref:Arginase n=2 Tax=Halomicrobium mukohataei TaxID=57705 RepID=C7P047_HALMD|nr:MULTISPECIES: arginase [Halomicrobium]ACV48839.1 arginase [Halomicrobium mukohataei DSM 12286]QCD64271.1 arginase [Halomicrobium mukohataei]QFR19077.1 arginase [Halomicrobium sp. ZPS1]
MDRQVRLIGAPMDLGADRRGVDMGPSAIRYAGLADQLESAAIECVDYGDVTVPRPEELEPVADESVDGRAKYLAETEVVCERIASAVDSTASAGEFPLVLGGDHSIAIGTVAGTTADDIGIVWFDAHGDCNTPETTPSGNVHGMPLAAILGFGSFADTDWAHASNVDPENVALVGLRSLDEGERRRIQESPVTAYTMSDIDDRGVTDVVESALTVAGDGTDGLHVSLDMDWLDPNEAPGVGTPVRGGVSYREAHVAMEYVANCDTELCSMEVVEANPILDTHNQTAELACELTASAMGKRIL